MALFPLLDWLALKVKTIKESSSSSEGSKHVQTSSSHILSPLSPLSLRGTIRSCRCERGCFHATKDQAQATCSKDSVEVQMMDGCCKWLCVQHLGSFGEMWTEPNYARFISFHLPKQRPRLDHKTGLPSVYFHAITGKVNDATVTHCLQCKNQMNQATTRLTLSFLVDLFLESMLLASNQCHMLILALNCQLRPRGPLTLCIKTVSECEYMLCWLVVGPHTWNCGNPWGLVHCLGWKRDNIIHPYVC